MVFSDVNKTYVRVKEGEKDIFYIKKSDVSKTFLKEGYISLVGAKGDEFYKALWSQIDVYDEDTDTYVVQNTNTETTPEDTLIAVHNAFFFRDGVGIDLEQIANVGEGAEDRYILVYNAGEQVWEPTAIEFSPDANNLSSNVSGLFKGRLLIQPLVIEGITTFQLVYNDAGDNSYNVSFPNYVSDTGDVEAITVTAKNVFGETISSGMPVHFTGTQGVSNLDFTLSRASEPDSMPAHGILTTQTTDGSIGVIALVGTVSPLNTTAITADPSDPLEEGDTIYVGPSGGLTKIKPTDPAHLVQNIGAVESINANNGKIVVTGPGRTNDVPNLADKNTFVGTSSGGYEKRQLKTSDLIEETSFFFTDERARGAISAATGSNITYDSSTGEIGINDSSYLTEINSSDVVSALGAGNGISIDSSGNISILLGGDSLAFNENGELQIGTINTSDLNNDGDGTSAFVTFDDIDGLDLSTEEFTFSQDYTANMPTVGGIVKTFGKYKNGDVIPANGKTIQELLVDAFSDSVAPTPQIVSIQQPNYAAENFSINVVINFGINNNGGSGTATLQYSIDGLSYSNIATYNASDVFFGATNKTFSHSITRTFSESNKYYYKVSVSEGTFNVTSSALNQTHFSYSNPEINNRNIAAVATAGITKAAGSSATSREFGDYKSTFSYRVKRKEELVGLASSVIQYNTTSSTNVILTGSFSNTIGSLEDESTSSMISFTYNGTQFAHGDNNPNKFRVLVASDPVPGTGAIKYKSDSFSDINFYGSYVICAGAFYSFTPAQAEMQTVFEERLQTTNGFSEFRIRSGSYPSNIGLTSGIVEQDDKHIYIIYPGSNSISNILLDGATGILGTFTNLGQFNLTNQFGVQLQYTVYISNSSNPLGAAGPQTLTIS